MGTNRSPIKAQKDTIKKLSFGQVMLLRGPNPLTKLDGKKMITSSSINYLCLVDDEADRLIKLNLIPAGIKKPQKNKKNKVAVWHLF